jgi:hypothetical protein
VEPQNIDLAPGDNNASFGLQNEKLKGYHSICVAPRCGSGSATLEIILNLAHHR